jgi:transposase InsO family protein
VHFLDQWFWLVFAAIAIYFVFNMFRRGGLKGALFNAEIVGTVGEIEASGPKLIPIGHGGPYATPTSCRLRSNAKSSRSSRRSRTGGARKIRELLVRRLAGEVRIPAKSTIHAVLHRHGLVQGLRRPRSRAHGTPLSPGIGPNDPWCADFKGQFKLGNGDYCYPLTATDHASRYLLLCEALDSVREDTAITAFKQLFLERGLPSAIRSDNGVPFASPNALFNLSKLSVWWLRLGIAIERIKPGHPQQNGRHERMHLTLKKEATRPAGINSLLGAEREDNGRSMITC